MDDGISMFRQFCQFNKSELLRILFVPGTYTRLFLPQYLSLIHISGKVEQFFTKIFGDKLESVLMGITMIISVILALGIFMVLPFFLTNLMKGFLPSYSIRTLIEGIIRVALFLIYIWLISKMEDIKRVFMYHGAEHKTINCLEHGEDLTPENIKRCV